MIGGMEQSACAYLAILVFPNVRKKGFRLEIVLLKTMGFQIQIKAQCVDLFRFKKMKTKIQLALLLFSLAFLQAFSQVRTVGRITYDDSLTMPGYTLFTPNQSNKSYLIENCGRLVHEWTSTYQPGMLAYLREDGLLLRAGRDFSNTSFAGNGGNGGILELIDWNDNVVWEYKLSDAMKQGHHDIEPLPNGNVLVLAWEKFDYSACVQAGRDTSQLPDGEIWSEAIYELKPVFPDTVFLVWEWHAWDHLIQDYAPQKDNFGNVADHPELIDINYLGTSGGNADWLHGNSIAFNPSRNEIVLSFRETSEIVVIDHTTSTLQAASHAGGASDRGGDLLYRWGNPAAYGRGNIADQQFFHQHDAKWVDIGLPNEGQILVFNNGDLRPSGPYSSGDFLDPPLDSLGHYLPPTLTGYLPLLPTSSFTSLPNDTIYSAIMGGVQMLPNGNTLVTQSVHGRFVEFDQSKTKVWEYISPSLPLNINISQGSTVPVLSSSWANAVFRSHKYPVSYPGFGGQVLVPGNYLEGNPYPDSCFTAVAVQQIEAASFQVGPNPAYESIQIFSSEPQSAFWNLINAQGQVCAKGKLKGREAKISVVDLPAGIYFLRIGSHFSRRLLIQH